MTDPASRFNVKVNVKSMTKQQLWGFGAGLQLAIEMLIQCADMDDFAAMGRGLGDALKQVTTLG